MQLTAETSSRTYRILWCSIRFNLKCLGSLLGIGAFLVIGLGWLVVVLYCALMERPRANPSEPREGSHEPHGAQMHAPIGGFERIVDNHADQNKNDVSERSELQGMFADSDHGKKAGAMPA